MPDHAVAAAGMSQMNVWVVCACGWYQIADDVNSSSAAKNVLAAMLRDFQRHADQAPDSDSAASGTDE